MSDPKQDLGPDNPLYYAPHRLGEQNDQTDPAIATEHGTDNKVWPAPLTLHENVAHLRPVGGQDLQTQKQSDIFAEAVARAERRQLESELVELPSFLQSRRSIGIVTKYAIAMAGAVLVALIYAVAFPTSQAPVEDGALSAQTTWQRLRSSLFPASPRKPAPTLIVRNNSGYINEPLELGVSVEAPAPGMTVMIKSMPPGVRLTSGRPGRPCSPTAPRWSRPRAPRRRLWPQSRRRLPPLSRRRHHSRRPWLPRHRPQPPRPHRKRAQSRSRSSVPMKARPLSGGRRNSWRAAICRQRACC